MVYRRRVGNLADEVLPLDLRQLLEKRNPEPNIHLKDGDTIVVPGTGTAREANAEEATQVQVLQLKYARAKDLLEAISAPKPPGGMGTPGHMPSPLPRGIEGFSADDRTNSLVVRGTRAAVDELRQLVAMLDVRTPGEAR